MHELFKGLDGAIGVPIHEEQELRDLLFADDAAAVTTTRAGLETAAHHFIRVCRRWGMTMSVKKTKFMVVGDRALGDCDPIAVEGDALGIEHVESFQYLGSLVDSRGGVEEDVKRILGIASSVFGSLRNSVWKDRQLSLKTKRIVYQACIWGTLNFGVESWPLPAKLEAKLETFHNRCLRTIVGVTRMQQQEKRITSAQIREKVGLPRPMAEMLRQQQRLRWLGHVGRMNESVRAATGRYKTRREEDEVEGQGGQGPQGGGGRADHQVV